jgi:hypothetical protein
MIRAGRRRSLRACDTIMVWNRLHGIGSLEVQGRFN